MALLHRLRRPLPRRLSRQAPARRAGTAGVRAVLILSLVLAPIPGCGADSGASGDGDPAPAVDPVLADSAGITDPGQVVRIELRHRYGGETAAPDTVRLGRARWVDFLSRDPWPRRIEFVLEELDGAQRSFLDASGAVASPPLVRDSARWLVPFEDAPHGAYPFRIVGPRADGAGVVLVGPGAT